MASVLLVDDEQNILLTYRTVLERGGHRVSTASTAEDAIRIFESEGADVIVTDMNMPGMSGIELVKLLRRRSPGTEIIVMTGAGSERTGIQAMQAGAYDYLRKSDIQPDELILLVEKAAEKSSLQTAIDLRTRIAGLREGFENIIGENPQLLDVLKVVKKVAPTDSTVLINGESGTGKELVAEALHSNSGRKMKPFVPINCGALPKDLQESELFGYVKGAFTGAQTNKKGLFEEANGGTIFLDELGEMELPLQVKLLRFLQDHKIFRIGDAKPITVDVRVICATNKDLKALISEKKFREDLYYRVNVISLMLPPLRDRKDDIPVLAQFFVEKYCERFARPACQLSQTAITELTAYNWPGNIRELQNVIERSVILAESTEIGTEHFPKDLMEPHISIGAILEDNPTLDELERRYIIETLRAAQGNKVLTCERLGISTTTLWRKLKEYGVSDKAITEEEIVA
ncbi:MAG: sigma-54 dependent transcriptional regulator [Bacteroidota bacterium]|nr:sigma-54 dependent transcriptional regulator [Bacteroidota bacterium]MDP4233284.1 sigma-54 dependent transcriptional regulator [Bacteroidota bacterium]MDP4242096.1 sigma-54 dependent transcriptional regulator [Bacteroidota bacterium]MDP4288625.1 sigma-54 dependent transcriptional regulator [Bacteroidota bacterium]